MKLKFKKDVHIVTSDFWYDITYGGYIKPDKLLEDKKEAKIVNDAINLLIDFYEQSKSQGILESM